MGKNIYQLIKDNSKKSIKQLAVLIDPDKSDKKHLEKLLSKTNLIKIDYIFIGGSMLLNGTISETIERVKSICDKPLLIFPGSAQQICPAADAFLLLSLISGRNAELLSLARQWAVSSCGSVSADFLLNPIVFYKLQNIISQDQQKLSLNWF